MTQPDELIIDNHVVITLMAGTTVEVGTISAIIALYLFPGANAGNL